MDRDTTTMRCAGGGATLLLNGDVLFKQSQVHPKWVLHRVQGVEYRVFHVATSESFTSTLPAPLVRCWSSRNRGEWSAWFYDSADCVLFPPGSILGGNRQWVRSRPGSPLHQASLSHRSSPHKVTLAYQALLFDDTFQWRFSQPDSTLEYSGPFGLSATQDWGEVFDEGGVASCERLEQSGAWVPFTQQEAEAASLRLQVASLLEMYDVYG